MPGAASSKARASKEDEAEDVHLYTKSWIESELKKILDDLNKIFDQQECVFEDQTKLLELEGMSTLTATPEESAILRERFRSAQVEFLNGQKGFHAEQKRILSGVPNRLLKNGQI